MKSIRTPTQALSAEVRTWIASLRDSTAFQHSLILWLGGWLKRVDLTISVKLLVARKVIESPNEVNGFLTRN